MKQKEHPTFNVHRVMHHKSMWHTCATSFSELYMKMMTAIGLLTFATILVHVELLSRVEALDTPEKRAGEGHNVTGN